MSEDVFSKVSRQASAVPLSRSHWVTASFSAFGHSSLTLIRPVGPTVVERFEFRRHDASLSTEWCAQTMTCAMPSPPRSLGGRMALSAECPGAT